MWLNMHDRDKFWVHLQRYGGQVAITSVNWDKFWVQYCIKIKIINKL